MKRGMMRKAAGLLAGLAAPGAGLLALLCAGLLRAQGLVICPSCGREARPGEAVCGHCGARLQPAAGAGVGVAGASGAEAGVAGGAGAEAGVSGAAGAEAGVAGAGAEVGVAGGAGAVSGAGAERAAEVIALADEAVREDVRRMRALSGGDPAEAYFYAVNALAVMRLLPPGHFPEKAGREVLEAGGRLLGRVRRGRVPCLFCGGKGRVPMMLAKRDGTSSPGPLRRCPRCGGSGGRAGPARPESVRAALARGRGEFERRGMAAGRVRLGRALVPGRLAALLGAREKALVMTGFPSPCPACRGAGREECRACRGTGRVKCDYPGCRNGRMDGERKKSERKKIRIDAPAFSRECPKCGGAGKIECEACGGCGSVPCRKCSGAGIAQPCKRCLGSGIQPCRKCRGSGAVKGAPCPECRGEGVVLCPSCRGEGAAAR